MAGGLVLQQRTEVEERCQPACMAWYPVAASQETFLVLANKQDLPMALTEKQVISCLKLKQLRLAVHIP